MYSKKEKRRTSAGHNLIFKLWSTKGARFVADERCKKTYNLSSFTIALLSFEVIAISIYSLAGTFNEFENKLITSYTLILSILFLVLSIFENAKNYNVKANNFHNCGLEIGKIYSKLKAILAENGDKDYNDMDIINNFQKEYDEILDKYENHEDIDYEKFRLNKRKDFELTNWEVFKSYIAIYYQNKFLYHFLLFVLPIILYSMFSYSVSNNNKKINELKCVDNKTTHNRGLAQ